MRLSEWDNGDKRLKEEFVLHLAKQSVYNGNIEQ